MKYKSLTTPNVEHDGPNFLAELIVLNNDIHASPYSWREKQKFFWGKSVAALKRLIRDFGLNEDQLAWYIHKCRPQRINDKEFGKAAVVAKKLFIKGDVLAIRTIYENEILAAKIDPLQHLANKKIQPKPKSLIDFLKELENEQKSQI